MVLFFSHHRPRCPVDQWKNTQAPLFVARHGTAEEIGVGGEYLHPVALSAPKKRHTLNYVPVCSATTRVWWHAAKYRCCCSIFCKLPRSLVA